MERTIDNIKLQNIRGQCRTYTIKDGKLIETNTVFRI